MDDFHTRLSGSLVAHSRYIAAHADALVSHILERLLACFMPIGIHTAVAFATKLHANLAVRLPHPGPYPALPRMLVEKNVRQPAFDSRLVAHSRMFFCSCFYHYSPDFFPHLGRQLHFRQQAGHGTPNACRPATPPYSLTMENCTCCSVFNLWLIAVSPARKPFVQTDRPLAARDRKRHGSLN